MNQRKCTMTGDKVQVRFKETELGIHMSYHRLCTKTSDRVFTQYSKYDFVITWESAKAHAKNYLKVVENLRDDQIKVEETCI